MKNFRLIGLALFAIVINACSSDSDSPAAEDFGESTGDYFPMADNNVWNYDDGITQSSISLQFTETIGGVDYFRMFDTGAEETVPVFIHKRGATYTEETEEATIPLGNGFSMYIGSFKMILLKDDLAVGETWTESPEIEVRLQGNGQNQNLPATMTYTGTILERGATEDIGPLTFTDVIKSSITMNQNVNGEVIQIDAEYWFAKDVGIIKSVMTSSQEAETSTRYLINYDLN